VTGDSSPAHRVWHVEFTVSNTVKPNVEMSVRTLSTAVLLALALMATACDGTPSEANPSPEAPNQGIVAGAVTARAERATITIRNSTEFVVGYLLVDSEMAVIALFPPCANSCAKLVQGESITVPYTAIGGYTSASKSALLHWFKYQRKADGTLVPIEGVNVLRITL
jgi:hypothetical protein